MFIFKSRWKLIWYSGYRVSQWTSILCAGFFRWNRKTFVLLCGSPQVFIKNLVHDFEVIPHQDWILSQEFTDDSAFLAWPLRCCRVYLNWAFLFIRILWRYKRAIIIWVFILSGILWRYKGAIIIWVFLLSGILWRNERAIIIWFFLLSGILGGVVQRREGWSFLLIFIKF